MLAQSLRSLLVVLTVTPLDRWLGTDHPDLGCQGAFEVLDRYVEALRRGLDVERRYPDFVTHIRNCAACREDTEGLLAVLDELESSPDR